MRLTAGGSQSPDHTASHRVSGASGAARSAVRRALLPLRLWETHAPVQWGVTVSGGREEERAGSRCSLSCVLSHFYGMSKDFQSSPCESLGADRCIVAFVSAPYFLCSVYPVCFFSLVPLILSQCLVLLFHSALCEPHLTHRVLGTNKVFLN